MTHPRDGVKAPSVKLKTSNFLFSIQIANGQLGTPTQYVSIPLLDYAKIAHRERGCESVK